jgi:ribonuclease P protein component
VTVRQTLKKKEILRGYGAYKKVLAQSEAYTGKQIKIFIIRASGERTNAQKLVIGFAVRKVQSAVNRNRIKRLMREVVRRNKEFIDRCTKEAEATHLLLMCSSSAHHTTGRPGLSYEELEREFRTLMQQLSQRR